MSEYEQPGRLERAPTVEDVRQLMGASTPHFAPHLRNRIETLISVLPDDHPARLLGEREIGRLAQVALGSERRGQEGQGEPALPSLREGHVPESATDTGAA
ncbi:MAG: hypothetical protein ACR2J6_05125 [Thermoleophilaceae bacterium]